MSLLNRGGYDTLEATTDLRDQLDLRALDDDSLHLVEIQPNHDGPGMDTATGLIQDFHKAASNQHGANGSGGLFSLSSPAPPTYSFEIWHQNGRLTFAMSADAGDADDIDDAIMGHHPDAVTTAINNRDFGLPRIDAGDHIAAGRLSLTKDCVFPIRHINSTHPFETDPYASLIPKVAGRDDERALVQVMLTPVSPDWYRRGLVGSTGDAIADGQRKGHLEGEINPQVVQSKQDKHAADDIQEQAGKPAFRVTVRTLAIAPTAETAAARAEKIGTVFSRYYNHVSEQGYDDIPISKSDIPTTLNRMIARNQSSGSRLRSALRGPSHVLTDDQLAGVAHLPSGDDVTHHRVDWAMATPGRGIPPGTPRYDFEAAGVDMADDDRRQLAMLDHPEHGDPEGTFWFGRGGKHGIEAGVDEANLDAHAFVGGGTRKGKTTLSTNMASQVMNRGYGGLIITLGKEDDDEAFIAEWPDDRPKEDFVFVDTGSDFEEMVRFNLLEVPDELEPGTPEHSSYVESLSEDMAAAFAQAGGTDNYWGALMSRTMNTLVHGMTKTDRTCTPLDLAACASTQSGLERFSKWMSDEHIRFIEDAAARIKEKEDSDLEPLAGRMDKLTFNSTLRTLLSAREPTVRIQDIVDDSKIVVLRLDPALGDTERNFLTTPLVRRFYNAKKMSDNDDPFFCLWDEFDKAVTDQSNVDQMLSEAGGYGFWFWLACQAPSHQLPDQITDALASQVETFISFGTSDKDARYIAHQHTVEASDLEDLGRYTFYMRTHDDNDNLTHSYQVDAFPPARDIRERVRNLDADATADSDMIDIQQTITDVTSMKQQSVERYGEVPETGEEIQEQSQFYETPSEPGGTEDDAGDTFEVTDRVRAQVCKSVYDQSIRDSSDDGWVPADRATARIRRYLPDDAPIGTDEKLWGNVLDHVPDSELAYDERDGEAYLRTTDQGKTAIFASGSVQNAGGPKHRSLLKDAYRPLTELGFTVSIPEQSGQELPDAVAALDDHDVLQIDNGVSAPDAREIVDRVEQFREDNPLLARLSDARNVSVEAESSTSTKGGQTLTNLSSALSDDQRCLFIVRENAAPNVWNTLAEEPQYARSSPIEELYRYYNLGDHTIDGDTMLRPAADTETATETVWLRDTATDEIVLRDSSGIEHARFDAVSEVYENAGKYPATVNEIDDDEETDMDGWTTVKQPVIPDWFFGGCDPDTDTADDMWDILIVPTDDDEPLALYDGAEDEQIPLDELLEYESGGAGTKTIDVSDI